jgi:hypothetical protein
VLVNLIDQREQHIESVTRLLFSVDSVVFDAFAVILGVIDTLVNMILFGRYLVNPVSVLLATILEVVDALVDTRDQVFALLKRVLNVLDLRFDAPEPLLFPSDIALETLDPIPEVLDLLADAIQAGERLVEILRWLQVLDMRFDPGLAEFRHVPEVDRIGAARRPLSDLFDEAGGVRAQPSLDRAVDFLILPAIELLAKFCCRERPTKP